MKKKKYQITKNGLPSHLTYREGKCQLRMKYKQSPRIVGQFTEIFVLKLANDVSQSL